MKTLLLFLLLGSSLFAQTNFLDRPYIETAASADTLIMPDRIYMNIFLNEGDSKGKRSNEEQEKVMEKQLKSLGVDTQKDLTLVTLSSDYERYFLGGTKVNKIKLYSLVVHDGHTASKVIAALEAEDISNVSIALKEYSKQDEVILALKAKAVKNARKNAQAMAQVTGKKAGNVLFITDIPIDGYNQNKNNGRIIIRGMSSNFQPGAASTLYGNRAPEPLPSDFQKLKFEVTVGVVFGIE
jgi:uncharacterized protein